MAYNYFPASYQPFSNLYQNQYNPTQQNAGIIPVRSEDEARNYPVAPGNSVTFRNESAPFLYTKTMGLSQFDRPIFERFRLVKEDEPEPDKTGNNGVIVADFAKTQDFDTLKQEFAVIKSDFVQLKDEIAKKNVKGKTKDDE